VAGIEEERGVARLNRIVERQQGLAERLPCLVLRDHHEKPSRLSVSPMVRASLTAFCNFGTFL